MQARSLCSAGNLATAWLLLSSIQGLAQENIPADLQTWLFGDAANVTLTAKWRIKGEVWDGLLKDAFHTGVDYAGPEGTPVYSASDGIVVKVAQGADGNTLEDLSTAAVYHKPTRVTFIYLHMKDITVTLSEQLKTGQQIGHIGKRGPATGPHLHFEARPGKQYCASLDVKNTVNPYNAAIEARENTLQTLIGATAPAFVGEWSNADFNTGGITRVHIRKVGNDLLVHMWGRCHPTECDWGEVTGHIEKDGSLIAVTWDQSFVLRTQKLRLLADGTLEVSTHSQYTDNSGREDRDDTDLFEKGVIHDWSDRTAFPITQAPVTGAT